MKLQRILAWLVAVCMLTCLTVGAQAQIQPDTQDAAGTIVQSCIYGTKTDISQFSLNREALETLFRSLYDEGRLPWYTDGTYTCYYDQDTGIVQDFEPLMLDETVYDQTLYEQKAVQLLDAYILEGMTPVQIALALHDALVENCVYDESLAKNTGYDLLVNGTTVCAGYAAAYQDLLIRMGVPCVIVTSEAMEHAWNLVQLDGQWYHVDVTWDDPTPNIYGLVSHDYFLVTDEEISSGEKPHYGWKTDITCTDTRFSDAYWRDIYSRICFTDNATACLLRTEDWTNCIYARDEVSGKETLLFTDKKDYINIGRGEYSYSHGSLTLSGSRLYYNSMDTLLSMDPDGTNLRIEYSYSTQVHNRYLHSCFVRENTLYATTADHDGNTESHTAQLEAAGSHSHSYTDSVEPSTCTMAGFTLSSCTCGLTVKSKPTAPAGHSYTDVEIKPATFWSDGWTEQCCSFCGDTNTKELPQIDPLEWVAEHPGLCTAAIFLIIPLCATLRKKKAKTGTSASDN